MPGTIDVMTSAMIDSLRDEVVVLNEDGVIVAANPSWQQFCRENGGDAGYYLGTSYLDICGRATGPSDAEAPLVLEGLRRVIATGEHYSCEYPCHSPDTHRWFELTASRFSTGGETYVLVQHRNITTRHVERKNVERAHFESQSLAALVNTSNDPIFSYDLDGRILTWNRAAELFYGYTRDEMIGQSPEILFPPDWPMRLTEYRDRILSGELTSYEAVRLSKSGERHTAWVTCAPIRGIDGDIVAISNIHRDVTALRKAEAERDIVAKEVVHRAKNMLSVVIAIFRQTSRRSKDMADFSETFGQRIQALSKSTDLLVSGNWSKVDLEALARSHTSLFSQDGNNRLSISGPPVQLLPQAVQVLGMSFHELATNSAKYGAFQNDGGEVTLSWSIAEDQSLFVQWIEKSDVTQTEPVAAPVKSTGFGSTVLTGFAQSMLDGHATFEIVAGRLRWTLSIPAEHFQISQMT